MSPFYGGAARQTSASPPAGARPHRTDSLSESAGTAAIPTARPQRDRPAAPQGAWLRGAAPPLRCCSCGAGEQDVAVPENAIPGEQPRKPHATRPQQTLPFFSWIFLQCAAHSLEEKQRGSEGTREPPSGRAGLDCSAPPASAAGGGSGEAVWQLHALITISRP